MQKTCFDTLMEKYLEGETSKEEEKKIFDELLKFYNEILRIVRIRRQEERYEKDELERCPRAGTF